MIEQPPIVFDDDNPEWTEADFARARPAADVLPREFIEAFEKARKGGTDPMSVRTDVAP